MKSPGGGQAIPGHRMKLEVIVSEESQSVKVSLDAESTLEDYLFKRMSLDGICPISHSAVHRVVRQMDTGGYGIVDLVAYFRGVDNGERLLDDEIYVYELKKGNLDKSAFCQIARYKRAFERAIEHGHLDIDPASIHYHLVGAGVSLDGDTAYLVDACADWLTVSKFSISLESGIEFEQSSDWYRPKENLEAISITIDSLVNEIDSENKKKREVAA